ncbi:MAG: alanine racemase [Desulfobacteraceae bacterium]
MILSPNSVRIDLSALVHNLNQVKRVISPSTKIMGVVKSDAYGHGAVPVSQVLENNGVHSLGVAHFHEALELRRNGIGLPIVILCGIRAREEARAVLEKDLSPVLFEPAQVELLAQECARIGKRANIYIKIDTGMGRLGVMVSGLEALLQKVRRYKELFLEGLSSHLSSADEPASEFTRLQIDNFRRAIEVARAMGLEPPLNNMANSAGVMGYKEAHFDMVRPGIMLYGGLPSPEFHSPLPLMPVMHFKGQVIQVKDLPDCTPVSYGRTYYTEGPQRIAVVSVGYGDGLPRSLSNAGKVLIGGQKVSIVGRVCMNMIMTDITGLNHVGAGDEAVFIGSQGEQRITGDDMAAWAGTVAYEIFCSLGQRNTREHVS